MKGCFISYLKVWTEIPTCAEAFTDQNVPSCKRLPIPVLCTERVNGMEFFRFLFPYRLKESLFCTQDAKSL